MIASVVAVTLLALCPSNIMNPPTISDRASASKIRRAAGSKDPTVLSKAIVGWTSQELDDLASNDGKSALHMAAWQGCIQNVELLLKKGCDVNVISTGEYSYGKTPIFFAATQSRDDIVQYLLENTNARVKIVNNKGQSVLSIASSHLKPTTIQMIQRAEELEASEWTNYRSTHSDGLVYGDLDPRFLERPRSSADVVTPLAINPTTKQSRRRAFARKNPQKAKELARRQDKKQQAKQKSRPVPSHEELQHQTQVWESIQSCVLNEEYTSIVSLLMEVVRFEERQRRAWIPQATAKLQCVLLESTTADKNDDLVVRKLEETVEAFCKDVASDCTKREISLLQKWLKQACKAPTVDDDERTYESKTTSLRTVSKQGKTQTHQTGCIVNLSLPPWSTACQAVEGLSQFLLQNPSRHEANLSLPDPPTWIDTEQQIKILDATLHNLARQPNPCVVALDTEWYTNEQGETHVSTIQVSTVVPEENDDAVTLKQLQTWIVDLLSTSDDESYRERIQALLAWLFEQDSNVTLVGFAFAHDISMLGTLCGSLSLTKCLDIQNLATQEMKRTKQTLPGLQACANHYLSGGTYSLSKSEQCSEWGRRPLRDAQLEYAGLDAAVLLVMLAEIAKSA